MTFTGPRAQLRSPICGGGLRGWQAARKEPALPWKRARRSRGSEEQASHLKNRFTVLEAIGEHTQGQRFDLCERFVARLGVYHHAGKARYLCDPTAILLAIQFYCESLFRHGASMPPDEVVANCFVLMALFEKGLL